jgi:hypothetical protein
MVSRPVLVGMRKSEINFFRLFYSPDSGVVAAIETL